MSNTGSACAITRARGDKVLTIIQTELQFGNVGFWGKGKPAVPGENLCGRGNQWCPAFLGSSQRNKRQRSWLFERQPFRFDVLKGYRSKRQHRNPFTVEIWPLPTFFIPTRPHRAKRARTTWHVISSNLHLKSSAKNGGSNWVLTQRAIFMVSIVISGLLSLPSRYLGNEVGKKA